MSGSIQAGMCSSSTSFRPPGTIGLLAVLAPFRFSCHRLFHTSHNIVLDRMCMHTKSLQSCQLKNSSPNNRFYILFISLSLKHRKIKVQELSPLQLLLQFFVISFSSTSKFPSLFLSFTPREYYKHSKLISFDK